jgi:hypothetical protein
LPKVQREAVNELRQSTDVEGERVKRALADAARKKRMREQQAELEKLEEARLKAYRRIERATRNQREAAAAGNIQG